MKLSISHCTRLVFGLSLAFVPLIAAIVAADDAKSKKDSKGAEATKEVTIDDIKLKVPESWEQQETTSRLRKAQFQIPQAKGDSEPAELVVFYFGGSGGGVSENLDRWVKQFKEEGRKAKLTEGTSPQGKYAIADVSGTYNKPIGPPIQQKTEPLPGARMFAAVLSVPDKGNYFLKLTGPEKTVTAAEKAFRNSFGADASKEKELKQDEK